MPTPFFMSQEIWKAIDGYEGKYLISTKGRIMNTRYVKSLLEVEHPQYKDSKGYYTTNLRAYNKSTRERVHRLVAQTFIPNPNNLEYVCHIDDDPSNNSVDNLFWGSPQDNNTDKVLKGRQPAKLTVDQVHTLRSLHTTGNYSIYSLAHRFNLTWDATNRIIEGRSWKHLDTPAQP